MLAFRVFRFASALLTVGLVLLLGGCDDGSSVKVVGSTDVSLDVASDPGEAPTCEDGAQNGHETDLDCGGPDCAPCENGRACQVSSDCTSHYCDGGTCAASTCPEVPCAQGHTCYRGTCYASCDGGDTCQEGSRCYDQRHCAPVDCDGVDCHVGEACYRGVCHPTCAADEDCPGGRQCIDNTCIDPCDGVECEAGTRCHVGVCYSTCDAQADCGEQARCDDGGCVPRDCSGVECRGDEVCYFGTCYPSCATAIDCTSPSALCDRSACVTPTCDDGLDNGQETDVDCGGPDCPACPNGSVCTDHSDCSSAACDEGVCADDLCDEAACLAGDGWYDNGASSPCCDSGQACTCQDQEFRSYACDGDNCVFSVTDTRTTTSACTACNDQDACTTDSCSAGSCQSAAICSATATSCGCAGCTDCTASDGWYDQGGNYACCDSGQACTCQDQEFRSYACDGTSCTFSVTNTRTQSSGCSSCSDGNDCTFDSCSAGSCTHQPRADGTSCGQCAECQSGFCQGQCNFQQHCCGPDGCFSNSVNCP